uniref:Uncharacterized protein n=1 Tax=Physcomitrium patens TaxID=3218 RepID=A0A2K1KLL6_PHYPA|nr:hypothetical protein PHYPA_005562 [Physcomitrium patens]
MTSYSSFYARIFKKDVNGIILFLYKFIVWKI